MAQLRVSIVFESGSRIGPGKAKLLESIRDTGSISAAARDMGMSYKRAWVLLNSINQAFNEPVVTAHSQTALPRSSNLTRPLLFRVTPPGCVAEASRAPGLSFGFSSLTIPF